MRRFLWSTFAAGASLAATLLPAEAFAANPPCANTGLPGTPVYVAGSSAAKPMLKQISQTLATANPAVRLVYQSLGSCAGLADITTSTKEKTTGAYWDANNAELACDVPIDGVAIDLAISDVFASSCANITVPAGLKDFTGSAQVFDFVVPPTSKESIISMEAAFVVYGWGGMTNTVDPWSDKNFIFLRDPTKSGTYAMTTKLLGLDPSKMKGTIPGAGKSGDILTAVHGADATSPNAAIGIMSADYADANRGGASAVKILAYQHKGAGCGFFPDSTSTALDKANVRSGLYPFWGPLHYIVAVDGQGNPTNSNVAAVLEFFTRAGLDDTNKQKMIDNEVAAFTVPLCAMKVNRSAEVAPVDSGLAKYDAPEPCGCYYESKATGAAPKACTACQNDQGCGSSTPKCRFGFCEAK